MQGIKDLLESERGVFAIALVVMSGVFVLAGKLDVGVWLDYTKWIGSVIIASKTITTAVDLFKNPSAPATNLPEAKTVKDGPQA